jgi:5'-nucleotidase
MRILVTNDDGITSEGIQTIASVLRTRHEVWVVAPSTNRSGVSHGITMNDPLRIWNHGEREFSCTGLPADCFMAGSQGIMGEKPDVVISGINKGANLGSDIIYSGTAAAARQSSIAGIPGIAVSLVSDHGPFYWKPLAQFVLENLELLISLCDIDVFVNINAPSLLEYKGARMTGISRRDYHDSIIMHDGPDGCRYSFFKGGKIQTMSDGNADWDAVEAGYISVSRVFAQPVTAPGGPSGPLLFRV